MSSERLHISAAPDLTRRQLLQFLIASGLLGRLTLQTYEAQAQSGDMLIHNFANEDLVSKLGHRWRGVSDQVMGGVSQASVVRDVIDGHPCLRLTGVVRLENNGGFIQASLDLGSSGDGLDASGYAGVRMTMRGNGEQYSVHLRTLDIIRPWQSYRAHFVAGPTWETIDLPFESFSPYRLAKPLNLKQLRRIGLVAIGRAFHADLAISMLGFYRQA